jgi:hypothetical protein
MAAAVGGSLAAYSDILKLLSLTDRVFEEGGASGRAEENAHSSSSAGRAVGAESFAEGLGLAKSNIDF